MSEEKNNLYAFQEWLEGKISEVLPADMTVICRRKGNIDNDISNALTKIGVAVVVEPPLVTRWANTFVLKAEEVESEIHFVENVVLKKTPLTASGLMLKVAQALHQARNDELGASVITLGQNTDLSPSDQPIVHIVLPITNALNL